MLLHGAHAAARKPLVEALLEGHAPGDRQAPCVRVCFTPSELLEAPVGARVVLVGAEREPEWLNLHRPVVQERELVLLLWVPDGALETLRRHAPDFLDWVSHRIEVPLFAPAEAMAELPRALARVKWIAVAGAELVAVAAEGRQRIEATQPYDDVVGAMESGDVVVQGLEHDDQIWRVLIAHAEVQWHYHVILAEPKVVPPFMWLIDARIDEWNASARRLESYGLEHARVEAALSRNCGGEPLRLPRALGIDEPHMDLLRRVARAQVDHATVRLAHDIGFDDVAEGLGPTIWSDEEITPERIEQGLRGGLRDRRALADFVTRTVERAIFDVPLGREYLSWPYLVQDVLGLLYREDGRMLRDWDHAHEPSFEQHLRRVVRHHMVREHRIWTLRRAKHPSTSEESDAGSRVLTWLSDKGLLSDKELELMDYIRRGLTTEEIAEACGISKEAAYARTRRISSKIKAVLDARLSQRR